MNIIIFFNKKFIFKKMKRIIFYALIYLVYSMEKLPKYGTIKTYSNSGTFYLNANDFDKDSTIHIQFTAKNGAMNREIYYEFSDINPEDFIGPPSNPKSPSSDGRSSSSVNNIEVSYSNKYYYNIKKDMDKNYLFIKYDGFRGNSLKIENTRVDWGTVGTIIAICVFALLFSLFIGCFIYHRCKLRLQKKIDYSPSQTPQEPIYYETPLNNGYDSNTYETPAGTLN